MESLVGNVDLVVSDPSTGVLLDKTDGRCWDKIRLTMGSERRLP